MAAPVFAAQSGYWSDSGSDDERGSVRSSASASTRQPGRKSAADCRHFQRGACHRGDACHFRHAALSESDRVCRAWSSGSQCKFGAECRFRHPRRPHPHPHPHPHPAGPGARAHAHAAPPPPQQQVVVRRLDSASDTRVSRSQHREVVSLGKSVHAMSLRLDAREAAADKRELQLQLSEMERRFEQKHRDDEQRLALRDVESRLERKMDSERATAEKEREARAKLRDLSERQRDSEMRHALQLASLQQGMALDKVGADLRNELASVQAATRAADARAVAAGNAATAAAGAASAAQATANAKPSVVYGGYGCCWRTYPHSH